MPPAPSPDAVPGLHPARHMCTCGRDAPDHQGVSVRASGVGDYLKDWPHYNSMQTGRSIWCRVDCVLGITHFEAKSNEA